MLKTSPCPPHITSGCAGRKDSDDKLTIETLDKEIPDIAKRLPPFPLVVIRVLDALKFPSFSMESLTRIARNDPVISANLLAAANRLMRSHGRRETDDLLIAATMLGSTQIRRIITATSLNQFLEADRNSTFLLWHSRAVAIVAQELAILSGYPIEKAYTAGILHDVGQIYFHIKNPVLSHEVCSRSAMDGKLIEHETAAFGVAHTQVGAALARHWTLPDEFADAILAHHDESGAKSPLSAIVNLAETLVCALDTPPSTKNRVDHINQQAVDLLGIRWDSPEMTDCFGRCRARYRQAILSIGR